MDAPRLPRMRPAVLALALATTLATALWTPPAAAMHLTDVAGKAHTLEAYRGKWVVLNVWATWCGPCIKEMPELEALSRSRTDVVVLGLAADGDNVTRLMQFARALKVSYPIIAGNAALMKEYQVRAYPTTLLFDDEGKLVHTRLGQVSRQELAALLPPARPR